MQRIYHQTHNTRTFIKTLHGFLPASEKTSGKLHAEGGEKSSRPLIVVADADNENRRLIKSYLSGLNAEIINASGKNGIFTSLNVFPVDIDLLILGFITPESRRFEIAANFRADSETSEIPILAIINSPSETEKAWKAGVDAIVNMPVNQAELIAKVCQLVFSDISDNPLCHDRGERRRGNYLQRIHYCFYRNK
jgi:PleD family two-component response regulator